MAGIHFTHYSIYTGLASWIEKHSTMDRHPYCMTRHKSCKKARDYNHSFYHHLSRYLYHSADPICLFFVLMPCHTMLICMNENLLLCLTWFDLKQLTSETGILCINYLIHSRRSAQLNGHLYSDNLLCTLCPDSC